MSRFSRWKFAVLIVFALSIIAAGVSYASNAEPRNASAGPVIQDPAGIEGQSPCNAAQEDASEVNFGDEQCTMGEQSAVNSNQVTVNQEAAVNQQSTCGSQVAISQNSVVNIETSGTGESSVTVQSTSGSYMQDYSYLQPLIRNSVNDIVNQLTTIGNNLANRRITADQGVHQVMEQLKKLEDLKEVVASTQEPAKSQREYLTSLSRCLQACKNLNVDPGQYKRLLDSFDEDLTAQSCAGLKHELSEPDEDVTCNQSNCQSRTTSSYMPEFD